MVVLCIIYSNALQSSEWIYTELLGKDQILLWIFHYWYNFFFAIIISIMNFISALTTADIEIMIV